MTEKMECNVYLGSCELASVIVLLFEMIFTRETAGGMMTLVLKVK